MFFYLFSLLQHLVAEIEGNPQGAPHIYETGLSGQNTYYSSSALTHYSHICSIWKNIKVNTYIKIQSKFLRKWKACFHPLCPTNAISRSGWRLSMKPVFYSYCFFCVQYHIFVTDRGRIFFRYRDAEYHNCHVCSSGYAVPDFPYRWPSGHVVPDFPYRWPSGHVVPDFPYRWPSGHVVPDFPYRWRTCLCRKTHSTLFSLYCIRLPTKSHVFPIDSGPSGGAGAHCSVFSLQVAGLLWCRDAL